MTVKKSYDVFNINRKWHYRHVLFDIVNKMPIAELLAKKEVSKNIKNFLKNSIQPKDCIAIVSDLKPSYDFIAYDAIENEKNVNISFNIIVK